MPTIKVDDLNRTSKMPDMYPVGSELFSDSESYMNDLNDGELSIISGGFTPTAVSAAAVTRIAAASGLRCLQVSMRAAPSPATAIASKVYSGIRDFGRGFVKGFTGE